MGAAPVENAGKESNEPHGGQKDSKPETMTSMVETAALV
jgi:hypothetical protein